MSPKHWEIEIETEPDVVDDPTGDTLLAFDDALRANEHLIAPSTSQRRGALGASFHVIATSLDDAYALAQTAFRSAVDELGQASPEIARISVTEERVEETVAA